MFDCSIDCLSGGIIIINATLNIFVSLSFSLSLSIFVVSRAAS
jgi:hypothetical protein